MTHRGKIQSELKTNRMSDVPALANLTESYILVENKNFSDKNDRL